MRIQLKAVEVQLKVLAVLLKVQIGPRHDVKPKEDVTEGWAPRTSLRDDSSQDLVLVIRGLGVESFASLSF